MCKPLKTGSRVKKSFLSLCEHEAVFTVQTVTGGTCALLFQTTVASKYRSWPTTLQHVPLTVLHLLSLQKNVDFAALTSTCYNHQHSVKYRH